MRLKKTSYILLASVTTLFFSCDKKRVFDQYAKLNGTWSQKDTLSFSFEQKDTVSAYNLFLNIRDNADYPFNNLFVIVKMENPDNEIKVDTLEYAMANPDGTLMGEGFSDIKENKLWYQENFVFKKSGKYKVFVTHALRETGSIIGVEVLPGITEVGFRIEKTEE